MEIEAGKSIYVPEVLVYNEVYKLHFNNSTRTERIEKTVDKRGERRSVVGVNMCEWQGIRFYTRQLGGSTWTLELRF